MQNEITILVVGKPNVGKLAISQEIVDALRGVGLNVEWDVTPDFIDESQVRTKRPSNIQSELLANIKSRDTKITVKEFQSQRMPINNSNQL